MLLYLVLHRVHLFLFYELTFVGVLEISIEGVVLPLGLGVICSPLVVGGSRGLSIRTSGFLGVPPVGQPSLLPNDRLFGPSLGLVPLWEISGMSLEEGLLHRDEEPISFSLLSRWEESGTSVAPVDSL